MNNQMDENQISAYVNGQLSPEEEQAFAIEIETDATLAAAVQTQERLVKALRHQEYKHFLAKVKAFEKTLPRIAEDESKGVKSIKPVNKRRATIIRQITWATAAAASIAVIIIGGNYLVQTPTSTSYSNYYEKPAFVKSASAQADIANFNRGLNQFKTDSITQAILSFKAIDNKSDLFLDAQYVLAHCYYLLKKYKVALQYLQQTEGKTQQMGLLFGEDYLPIDENEVTWFKTLCLLADGQKEAARLLLNKIITDPNHPYYQKAIGIRNTL